MSSSLGTILADRYRLDARIGSGGMSTVYRAFDTVLERQVAIKRMHREIANDSDQLERFRREARAVAQLNHPNVVQVIDAGEQDDTPFIVFEYVDGETLKQRIQREGRLSVTEAVAYAIEVARALGAAHERGIVHRDVKPQNVLINEDGLAKVTDFGIARTLSDPALTADGRVLGTTDYVSPEQAMGRKVTGQSDIYSLGVVLFEMIVGDVPFKADNQVAVAMQHVRDEIPDVQILRPSVGSALAAVVDRATAKPLDVRYPDTDDLIADLEDVLMIEASRRGQVTGEATTVFKSLPRAKRERVQLQMGKGSRIRLLVISLLAVALLVVAAVKLLPSITEKGSGARQTIDKAATGSKSFTLSSSSGRDFDPESSDNREHPELLPNLVDSDPNSSWRTENYRDGTLNKSGVGVYFDLGSGAKRRVAATRMDIRTKTPGWKGAVYAAGADGGDAPTTAPSPRDTDSTAGGWVNVGQINADARQNKVTLSTGTTRYRYYLIWITDLPPDSPIVEIGSVGMTRKL